MNFIAFSVATTNIFPCANSTAGGQLLSEFNLRSRESVATHQDVKYMIGPSYVHAAEDFFVHAHTDGSGTVIDNTVIVIDEGRGIVNGHYVESLVPIHIDLAAANRKLLMDGLPKLTGKLCIGLRAMYSTEATIAGSLIKEFIEDNMSEKYNMYEGIQVVILPESEFFLPEDKPNDPAAVTAHLKLASFSFINGKINANIVQNSSKTHVMPASRIGNVDELISDTYVTKKGLDIGKLYVYSGKGKASDTSKNNWCEAQDSLMVWDYLPAYTTDRPKSNAEAMFSVDQDGKVFLIVPHKQIDGGITDTSGKTRWFKDKMLELPVADYASGSGGTVDKKYTNRIKEINQRISNIYTMKYGKQRGYIDLLTSKDDLPPIGRIWEYGDYVVINQDSTIGDSLDSVRAPTTMYMVLPGKVTAVKFGEKVAADAEHPYEGQLIDHREYQTDDKDLPTEDQLKSDMAKVAEIFDLEDTIYRGAVDKDYFEITVIDENDNSTVYRYVVSENEKSKEYSPTIFLTPEIPLATEDLVGGFRNVPESYTDGGYVIRDENGHLVLLDYALLRSGVLAYQLGEDFETSGGLDAAGIQDELNEHVNQRVAFPNQQQINNADDPNVINITLDLSKEESAEINVYDIDARFNTAVYLHIRGTADSNTVINISDCARIRIDENIEGSPVINLYRCGLYYSATILNYLNEIEDMSLWYSRFKYYSEDGEVLSFDPNLQIDGMTVRQIDGPVVANELDYWSEEQPNDNHYMYAMKSVSFAPTGDIIGAEVLVRNSTTPNNELGHHIFVSKFEFPQTVGLEFPVKRLTKSIKITGAFITAVREDDDPGCYLSDTNFSCVSGYYDATKDDPTETLKGTIAFHTNVNYIPAIDGDIAPGVDIDGWQSDAWHLFKGGVIA